MNNQQLARFSEIIVETAKIYKTEISSFSLSLWVELAEKQGFDRVTYAIRKHIMNPDFGQYMPKIADVVKVLQGGGSKDAAALALTKAEKAIRTIGHYQDLKFDDPLIHLVIENMGGWIKFACVPSEEDLKFQGIEFIKRYAHAMQFGDLSQAQPVLIGFAHMQAASAGQPFNEKPILIGKESKVVELIESQPEKIGV